MSLPDFDKILEDDLEASDKNISAEYKAAWDAGYEEGYDSGYDSGYETGYDFGMDSEVDEQAWERGYDQGHAEGIKAEQDRIQFILNMMFESSLNMGQGNKAVQYKHAMDLLRPVEVRPYDPEDDGF